MTALDLSLDDSQTLQAIGILADVLDGVDGGFGGVEKEARACGLDDAQRALKRHGKWEIGQA